MFTQSWCVNMRQYILYCKPLTDIMHILSWLKREEGEITDDNNTEVTIIMSDTAHTVVHFPWHHIFKTKYSARGLMMIYLSPAFNSINQFQFLLFIFVYHSYTCL